MEVIVIIHELNHSGVSNAASMLVNSLVEHKIKARLVVVGESCSLPFPISKDVNVLFLGARWRKSLPGKVLYLLSSLWRLARFIRMDRPKHLFVWGKEFCAISVALRMLLRVPMHIIGVNCISVSAHLADSKPPLVRKVLDRLYRVLLHRADFIIAQSEGMLDELEQCYHIPPHKMRPIYAPLQERFFTDDVQETKDTILFVCRLSEQKRPLELLDIYQSSGCAEPLVMVGDGNLQDEIAARITALDLSKRVTLAGKQSDVIPYLHKAKVLVMTSKYEGFGMVLAEAIAMGVPVISYDCPTGPAEIIIDGVNGYLIPEGNKQLFAQKLLEAANQPWDAKRIRETAQKFHPTKVMGEYVEVISACG